MKIAEAMPEEKFSYKSTPPQRDYGQQILHVAGGNVMYLRFFRREGGPAGDQSHRDGEGRDPEGAGRFVRLRHRADQGADRSVDDADGADQSVSRSFVSRPGHLLSARPHLGHLRPDGGLSALERPCSAGEPAAVTTDATGAEHVQNGRGAGLQACQSKILPMRTMIESVHDLPPRSSRPSRCSGSRWSASRRSATATRFRTGTSGTSPTSIRPRRRGARRRTRSRPSFRRSAIQRQADVVGRARWPTRSKACTGSTRSCRASTSTRACWPTRTRATATHQGMRQEMVQLAAAFNAAAAFIEPEILQAPTRRRSRSSSPPSRG